VSTQTNESFWEPDPDTFGDVTISDVETSTTTSTTTTPARTETASTSVDRRQSIEEFLQMGLGKTPEKRKVKILSSLDIPTAASTNPQPPPTTSFSATVTVTTAEVDDEKHRPPLMGSIDYYEQVSFL
jgi:hypothetical protein